MENTAVLNELIEINNDRVAGFEKAIADMEEGNMDLKAVFQQYSEQSRQFAQELTQLVIAQGAEAENGGSVTSTLHRAWIDIKTLFTGAGRLTVLNEAERGEDAIKAAYKAALDHAELQGDALSLVMKQALEVKQGHDEIKVLRDAAKVIG